MPLSFVLTQQDARQSTWRIHAEWLYYQA